jgi:hypothetical protein
MSRDTRRTYLSRSTIGRECWRASRRHVKTPKDHPLAEGKKVTWFTNAEEAAVKLTDAVPFLVEDELRPKAT